MPVSPSAIVRTLLPPLLGLAMSTAVQAQGAEQDLERREAAAGFVLPQVMALGVLRRECRRFLSSDAGPDAIGRAWWERNRDSLEASQWVIAETSRRYKEQGSAEQAAARERQMRQSLTDAMLTGLRISFERQMPSAAACTKALERFRNGSFDIAKLGSTPGDKSFGEFSSTLKLVLADPRFRPPDVRQRAFEAQVPVAAVASLTQDAIEAAQSHGDLAAAVHGYETLIAEGDASAAMALAVMHLNGRLAPRNPQLAAGWLYNAWAMGDSEGLNALGVLWRDGLVGAPDHTMALAAFAMARKSAARDARQARLRASVNLSRMLSQTDPKLLATAGCLRWTDVHDAARRLASAAPGVNLAAPPTLPTGTLFDSNALDPKLRGDATTCTP